jgi:hypothetical protein
MEEEKQTCRSRTLMTICMAVKEVSKSQEGSSMCRRCVEQGKSMTTPSNDWSWLASAVAGPNSRHYEDRILAGPRANTPFEVGSCGQDRISHSRRQNDQVRGREKLKIAKAETRNQPPMKTNKG